MKKITLELTADLEKIIPKLDTDQKHSAFLRAVGRQIVYALSYGGPDRDVSMRGGIYQDASGIEICFTCTLPDSDHAFTMAAVSRKDNTEYSYHS